MTKPIFCLAIAAAVSAAHAGGFTGIDTVAEINADLVLDFDSLTPGDMYEFGDEIFPGIFFGLGAPAEGTPIAIVVDQGGGDLGLQMVYLNPVDSNQPSSISFDFGERITGAFATWERAVGTNNFDGGFGNPALSFYAADGERVFATSQGLNFMQPGTVTNFSDGAVQTGGDGVAIGIEFDIASGASDSLWIIDDVIIQKAIPCSDGDVVVPFGELNFNDVVAFLALFSDGDLAADLAVPFGTLNFNDVVAYLSSFAAGCP